MGKEPLSEAEARAYLTDFASRIGVVFIEDGSCGFGRPCAGIGLHGKWIDHNPTRMRAPYDNVPGTECDVCWAPEGINSYHKHDCFAVLKEDDSAEQTAEAVIGLALWIGKLEAAGTVELVEYDTGLRGVEAMLQGERSKCFVVRPVFSSTSSKKAS